MMLSLGLGCDRGTPAATIAQAISDALTACGAQAADVSKVASIDLKATKTGFSRWRSNTAGRSAFIRPPN